jgi:hypothetical protein
MGKYNRIWKTKFGANLPYSRVIRRFRVLEEELGETTLYSAFAEYVKISDPHYASVFSFLSKPLAFLPRSCSAPAEYTDMVEL